MTLLDFVILVVAGFVSGALNAVAGGGTFFTFAALMAVGLPPITANASSAVALTTGSLASATAYRREIAHLWRPTLRLSVASGVGGLIGALILLGLQNATFRALIPWLLFFATLVFAAGPRINRMLGTGVTDAPSGLRRAIGVATQFLVSVYGGFFGAGMGILMLASLQLTEGTDYHRINAIKQILAVVIQAVAIVVFVQGGVIAWPPAVVTMIAAIAGGYVGVAIARRVPSSAIRAFVIVAGSVLTLYYFFEG